MHWGVRIPPQHVSVTPQCPKVNGYLRGLSHYDFNAVYLDRRDKNHY
jgi:hypothetical protein